MGATGRDCAVMLTRIEFYPQRIRIAPHSLQPSLFGRTLREFPITAVAKAGGGMAPRRAVPHPGRRIRGPAPTVRIGFYVYSTTRLRSGGAGRF